MTIYKVNANEWYYWMNSSESGYVEKEYLFLNKENAEKFISDAKENPYWFNFKNEKVHSNEHRVLVELVEMKTED